MNPETGKAYAEPEAVRRAEARGETLVPIPESVARRIINARHERARQKRERRRRRRHGR